MLGRHDTDDTVTPSPDSSLSNGPTGLVDVCTALPSGLCSKDLATQNQDYTVISWDWGYSLFPFPVPVA